MILLILVITLFVFDLSIEKIQSIIYVHAESFQDHEKLNDVKENDMERVLQTQWTPTIAPTLYPNSTATTYLPTYNPTGTPTSNPTISPTGSPYKSPTTSPYKAPTTSTPSKSPSKSPYKSPTTSPYKAPSASPYKAPTTLIPTTSPYKAPTTSIPSKSPSKSPYKSPTASPYKAPTISPYKTPTTSKPSISPYKSPTYTTSPSNAPYKSPTTYLPTSKPSSAPYNSPTYTTSPSKAPYKYPTKVPVRYPYLSPTYGPSINPSKGPTKSPYKSPSASPYRTPTSVPSYTPTIYPIKDNNTSPGASPTPYPYIETKTTIPTHQPNTLSLTTPTTSQTENSTFPDSSLCFNGIQDPLETDIDCGGICNRTCLKGAFCFSGNDCINNRCAPERDGAVSLCDITTSNEIIIYAGVFIGLTILGLLICCFVDFMKGCAARKRASERRKTKMLQTYRTLWERYDEYHQGGDVEIIEGAFRMKAIGVLKKSRYIINHPENRTNNIEARARYWDVRAYDIWMYRMIALALIEATHRPANNGNITHLTVKGWVQEMEIIGNDIITKYNTPPESAEERRFFFEDVQNKLNAIAKGLPPILVAIPSALADDTAHIDPKAETGEEMQYAWNDVMIRGANDRNWGFKGPYYIAYERREMCFINRFDESDEARIAVIELDNLKVVWFRRFRNHPIFYLILFAIYLSVFLAFAAKRRRTNAGLRQSGIKVLFDNPMLKGEEARVPPGGYGTTFLPVPPQYNLDEDPVQAALIPLVYGFMHCALTSLCLLPICFWRSTWSFIGNRWPGIRKYIPIDDLEWLHRQIGIALLTFLILGASIWIIVMGFLRCLAGETAVDMQACRAFDPGNGFNVYNPVDNVVALRVIVWLTWFSLLPLIKVARDTPPNCFPRPIRQYWYEICYYIHVIIALASLLLALISRFQVFYPTLITWSIYILDWAYGGLVLTRRMMFNNELSEWHVSSIDSTPIAMQLKFTNIEGSERATSCTKRHRDQVPITAGKWIYLQIPSIDSTWHPFSVASRTNDGFLEFDVGVVGKAVKYEARNDHLKRQGDYDPEGIPIAHSLIWDMKVPTWTFELWKITRASLEMNRKLYVNIRGPYGTAFSSCFNNSNAASVVIGAGTGVAAAQSVLKEFLWRKSQGVAVPRFCFFVWSCQRVDDLLWALPGLCKEIVNALKSGALNARTITTGSNMLDWISITCYVTKADKKSIAAFNIYIQNEIAKADPLERSVFEWLKCQVFCGCSMDDGETHVTRYLFGVRETLRNFGCEGNKLSVSFCGGKELAVVIQDAVDALKHSKRNKMIIEFAAETQ